MRRGVRLVLGLVVTVWASVVSIATASDFSKFLHAVFEDQYGRPASGAETNYFTNASRTHGPLEAYIWMVSNELLCTYGAVCR